MKYLTILLVFALVSCTTMQFTTFSMNNSLGGKITFYQGKKCSVDSVMDAVSEVDMEFASRLEDVDTTDKEEVIFRGCSALTDSGLFVFWDNGMVTVMPFNTELPAQNNINYI